MYQTEKQLKELGDKIADSVKDKVEAKVKELKDAMSGGSIQAIKVAKAILNQEVMQLGQSIYSQPSQPGVGPSSGTTTGSSFLESFDHCHL